MFKSFSSSAIVDWSKYSSAELDSYVSMLDQLFRMELVDILHSEKPNKCVPLG